MLFLVVDDDALSRDFLTLVLEAEGYEVESAASGEEAVERLAMTSRPAPNVVLTDMQMPGAAGEVLATALRSMQREETFLLLAMSGSQPEAASLAAFDGFLIKPFKLSELLAMVSHWQSPAAEVVDRTSLNSAQPAADPLDAAAIDEEIFAKLGELMPAEQLGEMYALCAGDVRKRIVRMRALAEAGDDAQYRAEAHAVKGGCGMIGAREIYRLAEAAESYGLSPNPAIPHGTDDGTSAVKAALDQMSLACDRLERILEERTRA